MIYSERPSLKTLYKLHHPNYTFHSFTLLGLCAVTQSYPTLCDLMDYSPPGSSVHGIFQVSILKQVAISSFRGICLPKDGTHISCVSCIGRWILTPEPPGKPLPFCILFQSLLPLDALYILCLFVQTLTVLSENRLFNSVLD